MNAPIEHPPMLAQPQTSTSALVLNTESLTQMMRLADMMAKGVSTVPKHLANNPADCLAVVMQSMQWQMNPYAVAQKTHLVGGTLGYEAQLVNAVVQSSGFISGSFKYEYSAEGKPLACRVGAVIRGDSSVTWGEWLRADSVTTKISPLWKTNPKQQLGYLQVKNWARLYCPGAILGVYTQDELEAIPERDVTPSAQPQQQAPQAKPEYPADKFETNLPKWRTIVENKKATPEGVIAKLLTTNSITEEQRKKINALAPIEAAAEQEPHTDAPAAEQE